MSETKGDLASVSASTAFILGNGPSLRHIELTDLSDYTTIGLNAAYRHWEKINWWPTYYACLDLVVGISHKHAIAKLIEESPIEKFLLRNNLIVELGSLARDPRVVNFDAIRHNGAVSQSKIITTGSHYAVWAATMGFSQIVLLGVDCRYKPVVDGAVKRDGYELEIVEECNNPNYFFEGYQATGDRFNHPNPRPNIHLEAWNEAGNLIAQTKANAYNANSESAIRIFPFIRLQEFLNEGSEIAKADFNATPRSTNKHLIFFKKYALLLPVLTALFGAAWLVLVSLGAHELGTGFVLLLTLINMIFALYIRFATANHLEQINHRLIASEARLQDIERRSDTAT